MLVAVLSRVVHSLGSKKSNFHRVSLCNTQSGLVAIPFDNRNVRIYDLNGNRIARLPRSSRQGHSRYGTE